MKKFRILVVEDVNLFREALKRNLQAYSPTISVDIAANGDEALQKVEAILPDLIFMDIRLPGEIGLELTKKIKAAHPHTTIIILTAYDIPEYRGAASQYGADGFFGKATFDTKELKGLIKSCQKV